MKDADVTVTQTGDGSQPAPAVRGSQRVVAPLQYRDPDRYEVLAEHGRGGIGRVQRAHDKELGRDVAIKELIKRGDDGEVRFLREAMITARLEHPGIVPIHEAGRWPDGTPFYVMKLVAGRSLRELIEQLIDRRASVEDRLGLLHHVVAVADAVAYAHERDIIHRDLKPANVIAGEHGETIVIDWGLAKALRVEEDSPLVDGPFRTNARTGDLTVAGAVLGTPLYMSPEQARGEWVDQRTDVYAIGAMLWQLCSLERTPPTLDRERALRATRVDRDLIAIIDKALAPDPSDRYRNAGELAADLRAFQAGARIAARRYSPTAMALHWIRHHRLLAIAIAVAITLAVTGGSIYVRDIARERDRADAAAVRAEAHRMTAAMERDHARLAEASALLEKDPTRAKEVLETLDLRTPRYALLLGRAIHAAATRVIPVPEGVWKLVRHPASSEIALITDSDELDLLDVVTGARRVVDQDLLDVVPDVGTTGWLYLRKAFGTPAATLVSRSGARTIGELATVDDLIEALGHSYVLAHGNLYAVDGERLVQVRRGVRSVAGSEQLLVLCTEQGQLELVHTPPERSSAVWERPARCSSNPSMRPLVAVGSSYATLIDRGTLLVAHEGRTRRIPAPLAGEYGLALAPSGLLGVADMNGRAAYVPTGGDRLELGPPHPSRVVSVAADGDLVAWGFEDGTVSALDTRTGQTWKLIGHGARAAGILLDARASRLISWGRDEIRVWSLTPSPLDTTRRFPCLAFNASRSPDGKQLALDCDDGSVRVWSLADNALRVIHRHDNIAYGVAWHGDAACSGGWDGRVLCTDANTTRELHPRGSRIRRLIGTSRGDALVFGTDDGDVGDADGAVQYRHPNIPYALALDTVGRRVASGGNDGSLIVYDAVTRRATSPIQAHAGVITGMGWRGDELWTASMDGAIRRWRVATGSTKALQPIETLTEPGAVRFFRLTADGWSATAGGRNLIVHRGSRELRLDLERFVERCEASPDDRYLAAGTSSEIVVIDQVRSAIAVVPLAARGGYVGFASPNLLTVGDGNGLTTIPLSSLDYIAYELTSQERRSP